MKEKTIKKQLMADLLLIFQLEHRKEAEDEEIDQGQKKIFQYLEAICIKFLCLLSF